VAYSIDDAFSDSALALQRDDPETTRRLESFIDSINADQIKENYLSLAKLFWKMPHEQSVRLAHVVIVDYLFEIEAWSDIYLWSFSTLRQIPMQDTVWITRNYFAASLQALGQAERAQNILKENWMSKQPGSGLAYEWLSGRDLNQSAVSRALDAAEGKKPKEAVNEFLEFRATWLDEDKVAGVRAWAATVVAKGETGLESSGNLEEKKPSALFLATIDSTEGLTSWVLEICDQVEGNDRNNALLGITHAVIAYLRLDDSDFLVEEAAKAEMRGDDASVAIDFLSISALLMNENAYVQLAKILRNIGLVEQAIGYANVAVWKNLPGSADVLISLLGLDGAKLDFGNEKIDESTKVSLYKMANGQH
jgi:hypothetical protein